MRLKFFFAVLAAFALSITPAQAAGNFRPLEPIMPLSEVKEGMTGVGKTVFRGTEIGEFPVEILCVVSRKERPSQLILIRASGPEIEKAGGLASGMSGSPIYVDGRLIGAFSFGWDFGDAKMGLVTPIEEMMKLFDYSDVVPPFPKTRPINEKEDSAIDLRFNELYERYLEKMNDEKTIICASGLSERAMKGLEKSLGSRVVEGGASDNHATSEKMPKMNPGDSLAALLAWGDVTLDANGTLTAVDKNGRFIAYGHGFKNWGAVAYPVARATVYSVINGLESPFKLTAAGNIIGTVKQDRAEGIAGVFGQFPPAISVRVEIEDLDSGRNVIRRFQMIQDEHVAVTLLPDLLSGIIDRELRRQTGGTMNYSVTVTGDGMPENWTHGDIAVADADVTADAVGAMVKLIGRILENPWVSLRTPGLKIKVSATTEKRRLAIERVSVDSEAVAPGDEIDVDVTMRPWRKSPETQTFTLSVPPDAEPGTYIVTVRAGEPMSFGEVGSDDSTEKRPTSLAGLLNEFKLTERSCEVFLDLSEARSVGHEISNEMRRKKLKEGTMKIFSSEYAVEGELQTTLTVAPAKSRKKR